MGSLSSFNFDFDFVNIRLPCKEAVSKICYLPIIGTELDMNLEDTTDNFQF